MVRRYVLLLVLAAAALLSVAACGGGEDEAAPAEPAAAEPTAPPPAEPAAEPPAEPAPAPSDEPIVIGWTKAESGFMNFYDAPVAAMAELAVEDINAAGGVLGRSLKIIYADYKTDVNLVQTAALELLDQGVDFVHTACDYDYGNQTARVANERGILAVGCAGSTRFGLNGIGPLTFDTWHGNPTEGAVEAEFTWKKGFKNVYFIQDLTIEYSKEVCEMYRDFYEDLGGKVAGFDTMQNADASFEGQVNRVKRSNADAVAVCSFAPGATTLIKQLRDSGVELPIIGIGGTLDGDFWYKEAIPDLSNFFAAGVVASTFGDDPNPEINEATKRFTEKTGARPAIGHAYIGYSAIQTLASAIERAGTTDSEAVKAEIEKFSDEPLLVGPTTYSPTCHVPLGRPLAVLETENGKSSWVDTIKPTVEPRTEWC